MKWYIKIEPTSNGFVVQFSGGDYNEKRAYQLKDDNDETNRDHIIEMFYDVLEYFGELGNKYDKRRLRIGYDKN